MWAGCFLRILLSSRRASLLPFWVVTELGSVGSKTFMGFLFVCLFFLAVFCLLLSLKGSNEVCLKLTPVPMQNFLNGHVYSLAVLHWMAWGAGSQPWVEQWNVSRDSPGSPLGAGFRLCICTEPLFLSYGLNQSFCDLVLVYKMTKGRPVFPFKPLGRRRSIFWASFLHLALSFTDLPWPQWEGQYWECWDILLSLWRDKPWS